MYRCNPGGEVLGERIPTLRKLPRQFTYRLLTDPGEIAEAQIAIDNLTGQP